MLNKSKSSVPKIGGLGHLTISKWKKDSDNSEGNDTDMFAVYMLHDKHKKNDTSKG